MLVWSATEWLRKRRYQLVVRVAAVKHGRDVVFLATPQQTRSVDNKTTTSWWKLWYHNNGQERPTMVARRPQVILRRGDFMKNTDGHFLKSFALLQPRSTTCLWTSDELTPTIRRIRAAECLCTNEKNELFGLLALPEICRMPEWDGYELEWYHNF